MPTLTDLPGINAFFNSLATTCLLSGYVAIKMGKQELHKKLMVAAFVFSSFFLTGYLIYHYHQGSTKFPDLGYIRTIYLGILIPHVILAAVMVPFIVMTFYRAWKKDWEKHKKIAKITFPIWLYVSVTGIVIYFMLYRWFKTGGV